MAFASLQDTDFSALDQRLESLELGDDYEIYNFGEGGIDEANDDLNDDTFGGSLPVARDFDFAGQTKQTLQGSHPKPVPWAALDTDSLLAPLPNAAQPREAKTLAEIETEIMAAKPSAARQHKTLEEIEAEILRARPAQQTMPSSAPLPPRSQPQQPHNQHQPSADMTQHLVRVAQQQMQVQQAQSKVMQNLLSQTSPLPPPNKLPQQQQQPPRMHQANLTVGQLHGLRLNLLQRPQTPDIAAEVQNIEKVIASIEQEEVLRLRRAAKIADMAPYNNVMWNSEKDFITRIQLSQLLNTAGPNGQHDPLKEDFYFTVFQHLRGAKAAAMQNAQLAVQQGGNRGGKRKMMAVQKMAQQVQRLVEDARKKPRATQLSLDGALGKIALRSKSAPRQMLQVTPSNSTTSLADQAASSPIKKEPRLQRPALSKQEALLALEKLYDVVLEIEQLKRVQPGLTTMAQSGDSAAITELESSKSKASQLGEKMLAALHVADPVNTSVPHPFISLLMPTKGKKLLPRVLRNTNPQQALTLFTLMLATFNQLDVVQNSALLDTQSSSQSPAKKAASRENDLFLAIVMPAMLNMLGRMPLRMVTGMLGLLISHNDVVILGSTRPGIAVLTLFLSRAQILVQSEEVDQKADEQDLSAWTQTFNALFVKMQGHMLKFFPSTRMAAALPFGASLYLTGPANALAPDMDIDDESVWSFFAAVAVSSDMNQQQTLVTSLREKILENVTAVAKKWVSAEAAERKIKNVNLLLHCLGLDAEQISV